MASKTAAAGSGAQAETLIEHVAGYMAAVSYADALTFATCKPQIAIDGLEFERVEQAYDAVSTGQHSCIYELRGYGKRYVVTITPVAETHR